MHSQFAGFYPFTVSVWNFFSPDTGIKLKVTFNHHQCYFLGQGDGSNFELDHFKVENNSTQKDHYIEDGKTLAFPMYFGDETLDITLYFENETDNEPLGIAPTVPYLLSAGCTALCRVYKINTDGTEGIAIPPYCQAGDDSPTPIKVNGKEYYKGGTWAFDPNDPQKNGNGWKLTIMKKVVDPQSDDVTIGPGTPG
jgi:hypothetical protein